MAGGKVGNPNHDPRTGKFTSGSGLNRANSTLKQRAKSRIKESAKIIGGVAAAGVGVAAASVGYALLRGVTTPLSRATAQATSVGINKFTQKSSELMSAYGPSVGKALKSAASKVGPLKSVLEHHKRNMKNAAVRQSRAQQRAEGIPPKPRAPRKTTTSLSGHKTPLGFWE